MLQPDERQYFSIYWQDKIQEIERLKGCCHSQRDPLARFFLTPPDVFHLHLHLSRDLVQYKVKRNITNREPHLSMDPYADHAILS